MPNLSAILGGSFEGRQGTQGAQGIQGLQGSQGLQGLQGNKGNDIVEGKLFNASETL